MKFFGGLESGPRSRPDFGSNVDHNPDPDYDLQTKS